MHINGTYGDPLGSATLQVVNGSAYGQPFDRLYANVNLADRLITLSPLELDAAGGRIDVNGTFQHPRDSFTVGHAQFHVTTSNVQLANIQPLERESPGVAGAIQLTADAAADVREVNKTIGSDDFEHQRGSVRSRSSRSKPSRGRPHCDCAHGERNRELQPHLRFRRFEHSA